MGILTTLLVVAALGGAPSPRVYVPNQEDATISIIDAKTRKLIETIDLHKFGFADNAKPHHVQVEPDGSAWYVTLIGAGKVLKFSRDNKLLASASMEVPGLISLHPTKDLMFVARSMSAVNPPPRLAIIRRSDMKVLDEVDLLFPRPHGVLVHPKADRVYVTSLGTNQIASLATDGNDVKLIDIPDQGQHSLVQLAISPDNHWLVATGELTGKLIIFDLTNPKQPKLTKELDVGMGAFEPVFTGGGKLLYVTAQRVNHVTVVDTKSWTVVDSVTGPNFVMPHGIGMSADGKYVYVTSEHQQQPMDMSKMDMGKDSSHSGMNMNMGSAKGPGSLAVICAATHKVLAVVPTGSLSAGLGTPAPRGPLPAPSACR